MPPSDTLIRAKLIDALKASDERLREERADRIIWMSACLFKPKVIIGRPETLALFSEAESAFREGHFISVQLLALAFVEHTISEELIERSLAKEKEKVNFERAIELAQKNLILSTELLSRVDRLREVRNPFAHLRPSEDPFTYGNRYINLKVYPLNMLEKDAREAFQVMCEVFSALLKTA